MFADSRDPALLTILILGGMAAAFILIVVFSAWVIARRSPRMHEPTFRPLPPSRSPLERRKYITDTDTTHYVPVIYDGGGSSSDCSSDSGGGDCGGGDGGGGD